MCCSFISFIKYELNISCGHKYSKDFHLLFNDMHIQSTPVISRQLGAKIRERELSGSPVISRFRAKAQTRDFQDQSPTL